MATDSLFDPTGPNTERGAGNRYLGEQGVNRSKMPPSLVDGQTAEEATPDVAAPFTDDPEDAAERLREMQKLTPTGAEAGDDDESADARDVPPMSAAP